MNDLLLSDQEQALIDALLAGLYYPTEGSVQALFQQFQTITGQSQVKVAETLLTTTSIQQRLRRDFIIQKIFGQSNIIGRKEAELLIAKLGQDPTGLAPIIAGLNLEAAPAPAITALDQETIDQITIFNTVDQECQKLFGLVYGQFNVAPYYSLLKQLKAQELAVLEKAVKDFIATLASQEEKALFQPAAVPRIISELLTKGQMGSVLNKPASMADAGILLRNILFIATAISQNMDRPAPLTDAEVIAKIGTLFYVTDSPLNLGEN